MYVLELCKAALEVFQGPADINDYKQRNSDLNLEKLISIAPLIQGIWHNNDYVSTVKLVNT